MRVAFDSRAIAGRRDAGHYARGLLAALHETAGEHNEVVECSRVRGGRYDLFHAPCSEAAMLRSPCPMVVTIDDVNRLVRRSERLRCGGVHLRLRHLALQRATRVIVPSAVVAEQALAKLGLERERVVVIAPPPDEASGSDVVPVPDEASAPGAPAWSWRDVAHATWQVYERALAEPIRALDGRHDAISPLGSTSGRGPGPQPDLPPALQKVLRLQ